MQLLQQGMEGHAEAVERCRVLYAGEAQADHICHLFCSWDGTYEVTPGCLLQQVMRPLPLGLLGMNCPASLGLPGNFPPVSHNCASAD